MPGEAPHRLAQLKAVELKMTNPFQTARTLETSFRGPRRMTRGRDLFRRERTCPFLLLACLIGWVGSSIAPPLPAYSRRSEHSEARMKRGKGPKQSYLRPKEEKERLECYEGDDNENFLLTNDLKAMEILANFQMRLMDKYNERGDPSDHINIYKMKLQGQSPAVKCQNFHTTLVSDAKRWYNKLKPGNIGNWPQLKRKFVNAFIGNRTMIANITQLNNIRQKEGKTIKSYFKRFSNVIKKIETVTDEKALDTLVTGLHVALLSRRMCKIVNRRPTVSW
ncbi:Integrase catalytic domain-containing protein [Abeliophyllum distichum]|uniref:Integrase catalytic domain-containing protein n=1 Tax=Abeliophyllum distichum TaxID=126358 RepID=A0ABD1RTC0_9LAMI